VRVGSVTLQAFANATATVARLVAKIEDPIDVCSTLRGWRDSGYKEGGAFEWLATVIKDSGIDLRAFLTAGGALEQDASALRDAGLTRHESEFVLDVSAYGATLGILVAVSALG